MKLPLDGIASRSIRPDRLAAPRPRIGLLFEVLRLRAALSQAQVELEDMRNGERRASQLALCDELTQLPNRRHLFQCLEQSLADAGRGGPGLAVLFVDLDGFKAINDNHGHPVGDAVLRIVAARLRGAIRGRDTVVRFGGDEFVCLVHCSSDPAPLQRLGTALVETVSRPMRMDALSLSVRPSIGIAMSPPDGGCADTLIAQADQAMYRAKRERLGCTFFAPDQTTNQVAPVSCPVSSPVS